MCFSLGWEKLRSKIRSHFRSLSPFLHQLLSPTTPFSPTVFPCLGFMKGSLHHCGLSASLANSSWLPSEKQETERRTVTGLVIWHGFYFCCLHPPCRWQVWRFWKIPLMARRWISNGIRLAHSSIIAIVPTRSIFRLCIRMRNSCHRPVMFLRQESSPWKLKVRHMPAITDFSIL